MIYVIDIIYNIDNIYISAADCMVFITYNAIIFES